MVFENPHSNAKEKAVYQGSEPEVWGCLNYKTSAQHVIVAMCLTQPEM